ncbi:MAG: EscU/YscU/HrcU family type III secretion system export apparatus switch protein [Gammaproteobacteria bacterium]|nr:EscU/YscU/HrcU family type III secretion system export apparatus switch protein [Gammaproteobacteria bacterium]
MKTEHKIAVALEYDGSNAPKVSAKGIGELAEQILELARQHNIPLQADNELVEILAQINLGEEIPEQLYYAVAEVIAFAYMLKGKFPEGFEHTGVGGT